MENQLVDSSNIILIEKNNIQLIRVEHKDEFEIFDVERNISFKVSIIFAMNFLKFQNSVNIISSIEERHKFFRCSNCTNCVLSEELYILAFLLIYMILFSIPIIMIDSTVDIKNVIFAISFNIVLASIMSIYIPFSGDYPENSWYRACFGVWTGFFIVFEFLPMGTVLKYYQIEFNYFTFIIPLAIIAIYFGILICFIFIDLQKISKIILIIFSLISVAILECVLYVTSVLKLETLNEVIMLSGGSLLMVWIIVSSFLFFFCEIYCKFREIFIFLPFLYCTIFYPIFFFLSFIIYTIPLLICSVFKWCFCKFNKNSNNYFNPFQLWIDTTYKGFILSRFYFRYMISLK
jgi:hypothetical protein